MTGFILDGSERFLGEDSGAIWNCNYVLYEDEFSASELEIKNTRRMDEAYVSSKGRCLCSIHIQRSSEGSPQNKLIAGCPSKTACDQLKSVEEPGRKCLISLQRHHRRKEVLHSSNFNHWAVPVMHGRAKSSTETDAPLTLSKGDLSQVTQNSLMRFTIKGVIYTHGFFKMV